MVLSLRLGDMTLTPQGEPGATTPAARDGAVSYSLAPLLLHGRYSLDVRPERASPLDTGGDLAPLGQAPSSPGHAVPRKLDEKTHEEHLKTARAERAKLAKGSPNGFRLVSTYYQHNETFDEAMNSSYMNGWDANGVTAQMASDTHTAMASTTQVVNRTAAYTDTGGKQVTYNENAFTQHSSLMSALVYLKKNAAEGDKDRYARAKSAAEAFKSHVEDTDNTKSKTTPRTAPQIRETVKTAPVKGQAEVVGVDDDVYLDPDRYLERVEREGPGALPPGLDVEDLRHLQLRRAVILAADAAASAPVGEVYYQGSFQALIEGATVTAVPAGDRDGEDGGPGWVQADVPEPAVDFDDSAWQGEVADVARARIASMRFITVLLREAIAERVAVAARTGQPSFVRPTETGDDQTQDGQ
ncbi:hypothetical protein ACFVTF_23380 [Kitasatospora sp. NPDC057940]|uniref:hypothetical protein n=1 Tax=Kitasatospora sp. NPDC057940 TaxID=3346285 RepID=UPI0036DAB56E